MADKYFDLNELRKNGNIISLPAFEKSRTEAEEMLNGEDPDRIEALLRQLEEKLKGIPRVGEKLSHVPVLISLIRSYIRKEYPQLPLQSAIGILAGLIYVLSPVDLIPDAIPVIGMVDDAAVIAFVWKMVEADVAEYQAWRQRHGRA